VPVSIRKFGIIVLISNQIVYWSNDSIQLEISNICKALDETDIMVMLVQWQCWEMLCFSDGQSDVVCWFCWQARVVNNDFNRYNVSGSDKDEEDDDDVEDYGWKLLHGDVFRFPPYQSLFCAVLGEICSPRTSDTSRGNTATVPPLFRHSNPALCGSHPLVTT